MNRWRKTFTILFFCVFAATLGGRLVFLQVVRHGFYEALAQGQQHITFLGKGERGNISLHDKHGVPLLLATTQKMPFVFFSVPELQDTQKAAESVAKILGMSKESIISQIQKSQSLFEVIKKHISNEEAEALKSENLKGVYVEDENVRVYPQDTLASQLVGFMNQDGQGQYGAEKYFNDSLQGKEGIVQDIKNPAAYFLSAFSGSAQNGADISLTIDPNIQAVAESLLQNAKENLNAREGSIVVMNPKSGKIMALANTPPFNPNEYAKVKNFAVFQNSALEHLFEPGSVFKAITMAAALDTKSVTPDTTYTDKGILRIGGYKILNYDNRVWGVRSMKDVLDFSINTGAAFAQGQMGTIKFLDYVKRFGMFEPTGVDLPGEVYSQNKELLQGREINFATTSFGQGIEITPLQLVYAYAAIANGGRAPRPFVQEGNTPHLSDPVISQQTATTLTSMLVDVIEHGYGKAAKIPGYYIAGKTGTAQIPWSALGVVKSGYSDQTVQSFIGYAPAYNPQFLILVKLTNPSAKTAEYSAEPIFKKLAKYVIDYLEIPPDYQP